MPTNIAMPDSAAETLQGNVFLDLIRNKLGNKSLSDSKPTLSAGYSEYIGAINNAGRPSRDVIHIIDDYKSSMRSEIIKNKRINLSSNSDFELLDKQLCDTQTLNYEQFLEHSALASPTAKRFFTAQYFLMFPKDKMGAIASEAFLRYEVRSKCLTA